MQKARQPTVLVLDRARRVVTREAPLEDVEGTPPPSTPAPRAPAAKPGAKSKVVERLKRLPRAVPRGFHPMD